jgi:hypothetical protein
MSKSNPNPIKTTLVVSASDRGGDGKTTGMVLIANYLAETGRQFVPIDCDMGNCDTPAGFSNWFPKPVTRLDLRSVDDCDTLLQHSSESGLEFVLADLPANSSTDLVDWIEETASAHTLKRLGLRILAVCPVDQSSGAPESAAAWMTAFGERAEYLVMLNRKTFSRKSKARPGDDEFRAWNQWLERGGITAPFKTVKIGHLHEATMSALIDLHELPHKAVHNPEFDIVYSGRVQDWYKNVHDQLAETGLFTPGAPKVKDSVAA